MQVARLSFALALAAVSLVVITAAPAARADVVCDRFASTSGSDGDAGTMASPFRTPQKLVDSLAPGEAGCLRAGTYEFAELGVGKPNVTLSPYGSEAVTLRGSIKVRPSGHHSTIEGMKLDGRGGATPIGPKIYADGFALRDNEITNGHTSICVQVSRYYSDPAPRGVVIERNRIHDCGELPSTNKDHGIYLSEARDTIVRDNWIYDNADRGIQLYHDADGSKVTGNVIEGNGDGIVVNGSDSAVSEDNVIEGNVIAGSYRGYNVYSGHTGPVGHGNVLRNNCVWAGDARSPFDENGGVMVPARNYTATGNLVAEPEFTDAGGGDYRLLADDRCASKYTGPTAVPGSPPGDGSGGGESATVNLRASSHSVRRGAHLRLRGTVLGAQAPRAVIAMRHNHRWKRIRAPRIRGGRFAVRLRARTHRRVFKVRASVGRLGHSRIVRIRVKR
jgi:parallel beta-helix repeat protein